MSVVSLSDPKGDFAAAIAAQRTASDPSATRLASANAGSGKTYVLVSRVSRLLLKGNDPDRILCLTYTKAAAAEMQSRLFRVLGEWSVMSDAQLNEALEHLLGPGHNTNLRTARGLFAKALETPEGLKVQTIHAFCAQILKRFPMEAGLLPGFDQIDDAGADSLRRQVKRQILSDAYYDPRGALASHLTTLAATTADVTLDEMFGWMGRNTRRISRFMENDGLVDLADILGVDLNDNPDTIASNAWKATDTNLLRGIVDDLAALTSKRDPEVAQLIIEALEQSDPVNAWHIYSSIFYTGTGGKRASVVTAKASEDAKLHFGLKAKPDTIEAMRVDAIQAKIASATILAETRTLAHVAHAYARTYERTKRELRLLDYDDQIHLVHALLNTRAAADWVRYKLDGGIHHILIDEAQDTSDLQWGIIDALREDHDAPDDRGTQAKTFFAVGDEKQSIYSFQGAEPTTFISRIGDNPDASVRMRMSFRSAPHILCAVDAVFSGTDAGERMFDGEAAPESGHTAKRTDTGSVELWPIVPNPEEGEDEIPWDPRPVDALDHAHPKETLAATLATHIKNWLDTGEPIYDRHLERTRPMRADDILILVKSRGDFFDAMIRNLKGQGVPVAGADRLKLTEAMVVKDLLALARFALFPADDLSLAEVLKSPLIGYDEDALFRLAHKRDGSLWDAVQGSDTDTDTAVAALLSAIMNSIRRLAPYEFFATALDRTLDGQTLRHRIEARLGAEARDPLNEFLGQVLAFQRRTSASLQHFLAEFSTSEMELKREQDSRASEVRIMTVHGAKGLEAPLVILPQTTAAPRTSPRDGMLDVGDGFVKAPRKDATPPALEPYREASEAAARQEHLRLLYVAMTRAESRLIICGVPKASNAKPDAYAHKLSWYEEVRKGLENVATDAIDTPFGEGRRHGSAPAPVSELNRNQSSATPTLPDWITHTSAPALLPTARVTPSHMLEASAPGPVRSPLSRTDASERRRRFLRGNLIHKLLEILPDIAPDRRAQVGETLLTGHRLPESTRQSILAEALRTMTAFPDIFAEGSRAEVSLAGGGGNLPDGLRLNAQIDRLSVTPDRIYIVDYKSNRPPPTTQDGVSPAYLAQMAAYRELAREIYDRPVTCALLWTDSAHLMELDAARLDAALDAIRARLNTDPPITSA